MSYYSYNENVVALYRSRFGQVGPCLKSSNNVVRIWLLQFAFLARFAFWGWGGGEEVGREMRLFVSVPF